MTETSDNPASPGDDLTALTDEQLRRVVREYGWNSPWHGDEDERTPETELLDRFPAARGLHFAIRLALRAEHDPEGDVLSAEPVRPSPATQALQAWYRAWRDNWLDAGDLDFSAPEKRTAHALSAQLDTAAENLARARQRVRLAREHAAATLRAVAETDPVPAPYAAELFRVSEATVGEWLDRP
ncbi:hypothetical protein [Amycolatopsis rubida]|uniref:Uncharacterized protein n=1 Tax=Amycolatopsis rubida TaxID=112413 RepID=A0A1I5X862_9PSEU|nr:hypothetical protein [Amycolatopsis rubida]SFQ28179.1 hypothetical protein SAMN05421854_11092 [Amycolatopsis rubida]